MNIAESHSGAPLRPTHYWRLWLLNTALVCAGVLFYLATQYGTYEFFGKAMVMALLPFIAVIVLVGGAGSTIFVLTKVLIEKRGLKLPAALALLMGPGLLLTALLVLLGAGRSPQHRLSYICLGNAPASATHIQITGYSTFLRKEWLASFNTAPTNFQTLVTKGKLIPADAVEFKTMFAASALRNTRLAGHLPDLDHVECFKRRFNAGEEHERGRVFALFDAATSTAVVVRECRD